MTRSMFASEFEREQVEAIILPYLNRNGQTIDLHIEKHIEFCVNALHCTKNPRDSLAFARPWEYYWNLHALDMLDALEYSFGDTVSLLHKNAFGNDHLISKTVETQSECILSFPRDIQELLHLSMGFLSVEAYARAGLKYQQHTIKNQSLETMVVSCPSCGLEIVCTKQLKAVDTSGASLIKFHRMHARHCTIVSSILPHRQETVDELSELFNMDLSNPLLPGTNQAGGYSGSVEQIPHLASTYAAINTLVIIGGMGFPSAYDSIPREPLQVWIKSLYDPESGSFRMHTDGEVDLRATYCALAISQILNLDIGLSCRVNSSNTDMLTHGRTIRNFLLKSQTYEGGFACIPQDESHGGYSFCGLASLSFLQSMSRARLRQLKSWAFQRQSQALGAYNGRTNKLVDACYSYWMGATVAALAFNERASCATSTGTGYNEFFAPNGESEPMFSFQHNLRFLLAASPDPSGGFRDKPSVKPDAYHTCYALSGIAIAQMFSPSSTRYVREIDPLFNLCTMRCTAARLRFYPA